MSMVCKLFRNKAEFEAAKPELEVRREKFASEDKRRREMAEEIGLTRFDLLPTRKSQSDPAPFYPEVTHEQIGAIRAAIHWNGGPSCDVHWPHLTQNRNSEGIWYDGYVPTEVMEEGVVAKQYRFFDRMFVASNRPDTNCILIGVSGEAFYEVAFWGQREVYDAIAKKLAEPPEEPAKPVEAEGRTEVRLVTVPAKPEWKWNRSLVGGGPLPFAIFFALMVLCITIAIGAFSVEFSESQPASVAEKEAAGQLAFHKSRDHDGTPVMSSSQLPSGIVADKLYCACRYCEDGRFYLVYVKQGSDSLLITQEWRVAKSVFDSLKVGDTVPPKPAEKPKPEKRISAEF